LDTEEFGLLARYCDKVCLCFDTDEKSQAGQVARARSIYELYQYGWKDISLIAMPIGVDPDEYIIKNGKEVFCLWRRISLRKTLCEFP